MYTCILITMHLAFNKVVTQNKLFGKETKTKAVIKKLPKEGTLKPVFV